MDHDILTTSDGRRIAFRRTLGCGPGVVFLGGLRSHMSGTKAAWLEEWAIRQGRAFLRFDYTGHGASSGSFENGCIGDWVRDAKTALNNLTDGPQVLVGSSMGGWIALLLARHDPGRIQGMVGISAAPDFTEDSMWAGMDQTQRAALDQQRFIAVPSEYSDTPYVITRKLILDGREHLVLRRSLDLPFPVRLLHGSGDRDVPVSVALRLLAHAKCSDLQLTIVRDADHRFSSPCNLELISRTVDQVS